jgi:predicted esterase
VRAVVLHGRFQDPSWINEHVVRRLGIDTIEYVTPSAGGDGSWYPAKFMSPFADNEPAFSQALAQLAKLSDSSTVLIGFSQGACLACEHVYRRGARALIAFTGGLLGPAGTTWSDPTRLQLPMLISGALADPWVPAERMNATADAFERRGARVTRQFHGGDRHEVTDSEISAARALLAAL